MLLSREEPGASSGAVTEGCSCVRGSPGAAQTFLTQLSSGAEQPNKPPLTLLHTEVFPRTLLHCKNKGNAQLDKLRVLAVLQH